MMSDEPTRILMVEDDEEDYLIVRDLLDEVGADGKYRLHWVATYDEGLAALRGDGGGGGGGGGDNGNGGGDRGGDRGAFDVCLIDYRIGRRTGLDFLLETGAAPAGGCGTAMILLTGTVDRDVDLAATEAGAADYLEKAELTPRLLERSIRYAIRRARHIDELTRAQRELLEAKGGLEARVAERTRELVAINESLQREIAERERAEAQLRHDALHDRLTELPNRDLFMDRVDHAIRRARRQPEKGFSVLLLNLDRFKVINDALGHQAGDFVLTVVARRLAAHLRPGDTLARLGGNDFAVLAEGMTVPDVALACARRLKGALADPIVVDAQEVFCSASVGVTVSGQGYINAESALHDAQVALSRAKACGKDRVELFEPAMRTTNAGGLLKLESGLRQAIERGGELEVYYQPVVALGDDARIVGFEALVRWRHPQRGLLGPDAFIPLAEDTGLIVPIGRWVLGEATRQLRAWRGTDPDCAGLFMCVNVSRRQLTDGGLMDDLRAALRAAALPPECLKLEITESLLMSDPALAARTLHALKALSVGLAVDDFGTGYSSLGFLRDFPCDVLKIDRAFVRTLTERDEDRAVVSAIIELARALRMDVVAEGIETEDELDCLVELGCRFGQGFYFSPALPAENAGKLLASRLSRWRLGQTRRRALAVAC